MYAKTYRTRFPFSVRPVSGPCLVDVAWHAFRGPSMGPRQSEQESLAGSSLEEQSTTNGTKAKPALVEKKGIELRAYWLSGPSV